MHTHLLTLLIYLLSYMKIYCQDDYKYSLSQKILASNFIKTSLNDNKITSLPRGIELGLQRNISAHSFINIPLSIGFSRASNKDSATTGKVFYSGNIQYGKYIIKKPFEVSLSTGVGTRRLNQEWTAYWPITLGVNIEIDSAFCIGLHSSYQKAWQSKNTILQYGLGIVFKIDKSNKKVFPPQLPVITPPLPQNDTSEIVIARRDNSEVIKRLPTVNLPSLIYQEVQNHRREPLLFHNNTISKKSYQLLSYMNYPVNGYELTSESQQAFKNLIPDLITKEVLIVGHTDNTGTIEYNQKLSEKRALACKKYLSTLGLDNNKIRIEGRGELFPIGDNSTKEGKTQNRRIEIYILKP